MLRIAVEDNSRMSPRISVEDKAILPRAVTLQHTDLTDFVLQYALQAAREIIEKTEYLHLSERDSQQVLDVLENPPLPNENCRLPHRRCRGGYDRYGLAMRSRLASTIIGKRSIAATQP